MSRVLRTWETEEEDYKLKASLGQHNMILSQKGIRKKNVKENRKHLLIIQCEPGSVLGTRHTVANRVFVLMNTSTGLSLL